MHIADAGKSQIPPEVWPKLDDDVLTAVAEHALKTAKKFRSRDVEYVAGESEVLAAWTLIVSRCYHVFCQNVHTATTPSRIYSSS